MDTFYRISMRTKHDLEQISEIVLKMKKRKKQLKKKIMIYKSGDDKKIIKVGTIKKELFKWGR